MYSTPRSQFVKQMPSTGKKFPDAIAVIFTRCVQLVHGDVDGALVDVVFRLLLLLLLLLGRQCRPGGVPGPAAEAAVALRRGVGSLHGGRRRLPPAQLRRLGPGRGELLALGGLGRRRLVVEARHGRGLERQALPQQLQSLLLLSLQAGSEKKNQRTFLGVHKCTWKSWHRLRTKNP
jgi:hypothetical protein